MRIRAYNIEQWADTLDSRATVPAVLRRLIHATIRRPSRVDFPAWEGTQRPGWDGVVISSDHNAFVPDGTSVWEIGTTTRIKEKANQDFEKRTADPRDVVPRESTYVCVTPRKWTEKAAWSEEKRARRQWKDVRAYDCDDIEQWLETAPAVAVWFGRILAIRPAGVEDVERYWAALSALTEPRLLPEVFVASRDDQEKHVIQWLDGPAGVLAIECRNPTEVIDFATATLMRFPDGLREEYLSRSVIVEAREAFDELRNSKSPLILLVAPRLTLEPELISSAAQTGHHVLVPVSRVIQDKVSSLSLPRAYSYDLAKALERCGFPEEESRKTSRAAGGSLTILKRRLATIPAAARPAWADGDNATISTPFLWTGGWKDNCEADRQAIARMSGRTDAENERATRKLAQCEEPLLIQALEKWELLSKDDAWMLLAPHTTEHEFATFLELAVDILGEVDPRFEMPANEQIYANIRGMRRRFSGLLRKNFAETIALLASLHQVIGLPPSWEVPARLSAAVRRILPANCTWQRWASLEGNLPLLAEASPEVFLDVIEADLASAQSELVKLFDAEGDPLLDGCHHAGLLWALEGLAWSPSHLTRACRVLLDLWARDPGGQWANRPAASLGGILSPWYPQTSASVSQRVQVIDACLLHRPEVAWRLLCELLPHSMEFASETHRPYWRDWAASWRPGASQRDYAIQVNACAQRIIDHAGIDPARWMMLLDEIDRVPTTHHGKLLEALAKLAAEPLSDDDRRTFADAIREKVSLSRMYPDAKWALPNESINELEGLGKRFEPKDIALKHQWLFATRVAQFEDCSLNYTEAQAKLLEARRAGVAEVLQNGGWIEVQRLASNSESPRTVGAALASHFGDEHVGQILPDLLASVDEWQEQFACGFIWQRFREDAWPWVDQRALRQWTAEASVRCLCCLPFQREAWERAAALGPEVEDAYWHRTGAWNHELCKDDVEYAARQLISRRRPMWAVRLIRMAEHEKRQISTDVILESLEGIFELHSEELQQALSGRSYDIPGVISILQDRPDCDEKRLATLEWHFLRLLNRGSSSPAVLYRWLANAPAFFVEVLAYIFRCDNAQQTDIDESKSIDQRRSNAASAFRLLREWTLIPGTQADGSIDEVQLRRWITDVRRLSADTGYLSGCDYTLGELLSRSPGEADGSWPCEAVNNVLESIASETLLRGFRHGIYNSRGVTMRGHHEGGVQERALADQFDARARRIEISHPKTAAVLRRVAEGYRHEAIEEDERATWDR